MYTEDPITESSLIQKYSDIQEKTCKYAAYILELELEIKNIRERIKEVRTEAKLDGIAVKLVHKCLAEMKREKKMSDQDKEDLKVFLDILKDDKDIIGKLDDLALK